MLSSTSVHSPSNNLCRLGSPHAGWCFLSKPSLSRVRVLLPSQNLQPSSELPWECGVGRGCSSRPHCFLHRKGPIPPHLTCSPTRTRPPCVGRKDPSPGQRESQLSWVTLLSFMLFFFNFLACVCAQLLVTLNLDSLMTADVPSASPVCVLSPIFPNANPLESGRSCLTKLFTFTPVGDSFSC